MKYKKFAATALLAVAATGVSAGTSYAAPSPTPPAAQDQSTAVPTVTGEDQGVDYTLELAEAGKSLVTTVTGGAFSLDTDDKTVTLKNADGAVVTTIPLTATAKGQPVEIAASVDADGSKLTLTPQVTPTAVAPSQAEFISAQGWFMAELQRASLGALVGGLIGAAVGILFFGVGILPGAVLGAIIGLAVAGGPELLNAGLAYFSGQP
ncbi:hypothetical protein [Nocardia cyriacigeorgica]|uniref:hypothetical protein n=1 Tax=Nocardia cyriacigeorgica TaxID=135487 RepID=UPI0018941BAC|nr:hypothetical protein [Nocardia cyriacigeorgica]MBF6454310.1 hypothetical protein [Nocardia cyriacigeorgica]MBF6481102.1 hypothetical protein [Nocardia cyriacigeorgica]MBF6552204.1 hypothetical protein [Nocardia cyriacigeorgica]